MANDEQLALLKLGMIEWNRWRLSHPDTPIDLAGANLQRAILIGRDLQGADFRGSDLNEASLRSARLRGADLTGARLADACFDGADLTDAILVRADLTGARLTVGLQPTGTTLRGANLREVNLQLAHLQYTNLTGADLTEADLRETIFNHVTLTGMNVTNALLWQTQWNDVDLRQVIGLESVRHLGPSTIGMDTLIASHGQIPDAFLRGCGVSDDLIDFAHTLAQIPQYFSVFLSYGPQDEGLGTRLSHDLQANHVRCWNYSLDLKLGGMGGRIYLSPGQVMRTRQKLVVLISQSEIHSDWLPDEMKVVFTQEEQAQRDILVPITLDDALAHEEKEWAQRLREQHSILDFTGWENPSVYAAMFEQLLNMLRQPPAAE